MSTTDTGHWRWPRRTQDSYQLLSPSGNQVCVLEATQEMTDVGTDIQVLSDSSRTLQRWGLE